MRIIGQRGPRLSAFVEEWWALHAEPNLEPATLRTCRWVWEQHARPHLGALRLRDVTPLAIARFRAEREAAGAGVETIRKTYTMLGSVLSCAVEWQVVDRNPVRTARKPRASSARAAVIAEPEQVEAMRASLLACGRGARRDVAHAPRIRRATTSGPARGAAPGRSRAAPRPAGPVIARSDGGFWRETDWPHWRRRVFRPAAASAALAGARPYDLRHSFASVLIAEGRLSIGEIAAQLGHNPTVCLDFYHVMAERGGGGDVIRGGPDQQDRARPLITCIEHANMR